MKDFEVSINNWGEGWAAFRQEHPDWCKQHVTPDESLFRLPTEVTDALARPLLHGRLILSAGAQEAERAFCTLCVKSHAEGVHNGAPVVYRHFRPPVPPPNQELYHQCGWTAEQIAAVQTLLPSTTDILMGMKAYVGRLISDPSFLRDRDALRSTWQALPPAQRPGFPLQRVTQPHGNGHQPGSEQVQCFQADLSRFLDHYGLLALATWELPEPAGPLMDTAPKPPHLLAGRPVQLALPAHFRLQGANSLQGVAQDLQRQHLQDSGLDPSCVTPRAEESYAHLFTIDHFRRVANSRYGGAPRPKGYVGCLSDALAAYLGISHEHFRELDRTLKAFRGGQPHTGRWAR